MARGWRLLLGSVRPVRLLVAALVPLVAANTLCEVGAAVALQAVVNGLAAENRGRFLAALAVAAALQCVATAGQLLSRQLIAIIRQRVQFDLRLRGVTALLSAMPRTALLLTPGAVTTRLLEDTDVVGSIWSAQVSNTVYFITGFVAATAYVVHTSPLLGVVAVAISPSPILLSAVTARPVARATRTHQEALDAESTSLSHAVEGLEDFRMQGYGGALQRMLGALFQRHYASARRRDLIEGAGGAGTRALDLATHIGVILAAGYLALRGEVSVGFLVAYVALYRQIALPFFYSGPIVRRVAEAGACSERIAELLDMPPEATAPTEQALAGAAVRLEGLRHVHAADGRYPDCTLAQGDRVALVGPNGSGKSTLVDLLLGFAVPSGGRITMGGVDISCFPPATWRDRVAAVLQEPAFLPASVRINLDPHQRSDKDALWQALTAVGMDGAVREMGGLDAELADGGTALSLGQRQRLAVARVLLRGEARLVLLDEPFAAVDTAGRKALQQALHAWLGDRTLLLIGHRRDDISLTTGTISLAGAQVDDTPSPEPV